MFVHEAIAELFNRQLQLITKHPYENMELKTLKPKIQVTGDTEYISEKSSLTERLMYVVYL